MVNGSYISYFTQASGAVQAVMLLLIAASFASWTIIFHRRRYLQKIKLLAEHFEQQFWSGEDSRQLYQQLKNSDQYGVANIFMQGFEEFQHLSKTSNCNDATLDGVQRAMRVATRREVEQLEKHLPLLASVGSTAPYVGLFGTVWGIMSAFHALGNVQQATIAMVAPGISEALVATAMGLFAAIPAVLAYNHYNTIVDRLTQQFISFQEEFVILLQRQANDS